MSPPHIACPLCRSPLTTDPASVLDGKGVTCETCQSEITIRPSPQTRVVLQGFTQALGSLDRRKTRVELDIPSGKTSGGKPAAGTGKARRA